MSRHRLLFLAFAVSAAFNLGLVGTYSCNSCRSRAASELPPCLSATGNPSPRIVELSQHLQQELEPLRHRQANETHRRADLIAAAEPDRAAIASCLDRLAASERSIQGLVVETILAQQAELPENQRAVFYNHIRRRLCDPRRGYEGTVPCVATDCESQPQPEPEGVSK